jgi:hypothetical protein
MGTAREHLVFGHLRAWAWLPRTLPCEGAELMKFLVTATPIVPLTDRVILDKLAAWMRDQQQAGRITAAYGLVGGGGCSIMDVGSFEELHELTALCPIGAYLSFDIKPLIELDTSFAMALDQLPG